MDSKQQANSSALSRRDFMAAAGAAALVLASDSIGTAEGDVASGDASVATLSLNGSAWTLIQEDTHEQIPASVPGVNYEALIAAGKLSDPYYRENSGKVQWVADKTWIYEREFDVPAELLSRPHVHLVCYGLDTLATLWINDQHVADTDNMYRRWEFDVKALLKPGRNHIKVRFSPLAPYVREHQAAYKKEFNVNINKPRSWVRKAPYMWGWNWCRAMLTAGIWKPIEIVAYSARITDVAVEQQHNRDGTVEIGVQAQLAGAAGDDEVTFTAWHDGHAVAQAKAAVSDGSAKASLQISQPKLWWPNGMGDQPLYTIEASLKRHDGSQLDQSSRRIGLRTVHVLPPKDGIAMHVEVNGVAFFVKGADWIPADNIPTRVTPEILRSYMQDGANCHFNFIRLWGGGYYEEDALFDACDELGIMLQFEFKFANASYPVEDEKFIANVRAEVQDNVIRVRHHPSLAIWSGNNEIKHFKGYNYLFGDVIGKTLLELVPDAFYEKGSGAWHSGDIHYWAVWVWTLPFESYHRVHGFVSEFGAQSFPVPISVRQYTDAADRTTTNSKVMVYHERFVRPWGPLRLKQYTNEYFGQLPEGFDENLWLSQVMQAHCLGYYGVEFWRRDMPHSMAAAIWQLNDCWPGTTWSMIDWYHRWKAIQYCSRRFFAPVLVTGDLNAKTGDAHIYVVSDRMHSATGELLIDVTDAQGNVLHRSSGNEAIAARTSRLARTLHLSHLLEKYGPSNLLVWPSVRIGAKTVASNLLFFGRPLQLRLQPPRISPTITSANGVFTVELQTDKPALWSWLSLGEVDAKYSDNFVHLRPQSSHVIHVTPSQRMTLPQFERLLQIRSITDIAPTMRA